MNEKQDWMDPLDAIVDDCADLMRIVRRHLHAHPEPSGKETATATLIANHLEREGISPQIVAEKRGVIAESLDAGGPANPMIAIRADTDALHIQDRKKTEYASCIAGVMHACGHDAHTAIGLGATIALTRAARDGVFAKPLHWRSIFQPSEETNRGALEMVDAGALKDVAAIIALHVDPGRHVGTIGVREGAFTANCVELELTVTGRGGHAARPHESFDPIAAVAQLISSIYLFIPRRVNSQEPVVVSFGQIHGGENSNVIPDEVVVRGTLRTLHAATTQATIDHIKRLARGIADASETRIELKTIDGPPAVINDAKLKGFIEIAARDLLGAENVYNIERPSMGGEDFANYLPKVPGAMFRLGTASESINPCSLHSPDFDIDEDALKIGAKILARTVVGWSLERAH